MATTTYTSPSIRFFLDDDANVVRNAFTQTFYGAGSTAGTEADGYPDATASNVFDDITDYEITAPTALGVNLTTTSNDATVTASGAIFSAGDVGKFLFNGADTANLKPLGKIATYTDTTHVELEVAQITAYTGVAGYIATTANNGFNVSEKRSLFVLIGSEEDPIDANARNFPKIKGNSTALQAQTPYTVINGVNQLLNTNYINLLRISRTNDKGNYQLANIPASINRVNSYVHDGTTDNKLFPNLEDLPYWTAYEINPLVTSNKNLDKQTSYSLEIEGILPSFGAIGADTYYVSEAYGEL